MEISVNSSYFRKIRGTDKKRTDLEAALICKQAGITVLDCTPSFTNDEDWERQAHKLAEDFSREGIRIEQGHAPFNRYKKKPLDEFKEELWRSFKTAQILGSRYHVIHADEYPLSLTYDSKAACDYSYELFAPYIEFAEKNGFGVAIENLFDEPSAPNVNGRNRFTAVIEEQLEIIDRFNCKAVTACWDFGHANVSFGKDAVDKLKMLGSRLTCTHVHDNEGSDKHMPMYFGKINWEAYAEYLKSAYNGVFTYEFVYNEIPEEILADYLALAKKTAENLLK